MKLNKSYVKLLKDLDNHKFEYFDKCYLPDNNRDKLYENITRIDFNSLYANIQIGLFDEGLIGKEWKDDIDRVKWFLKNRKELKSLQPDKYQKSKVHCNSLYMKTKSPYVIKYVDMLYKDLIQKYDNLVIYSNIDVLYLNIDKISFQTKECASELKDFSYDIQLIKYLYIDDKRKYIEQEESGNINTEGLRDENKKQNLLNIFKREVRKIKLEKLGIY
jgi:hypothetical protein